MIQTKGYKAFKGILKIKTGEISLAMRGDWVYDPKDKMWHSDFGAFFGDLCEIMTDENVCVIKRKDK